MEYKVKEMTKQIETIKKTSVKLQQLSNGIPAVDRNVGRILASVKMLEINISDLI